jgi:hypothetical protein
MLLYKTTYQVQNEKDEPVKTLTIWNGSAKDAGTARKRIRQTYGFIPNSVQSAKIDIPTDKAGLLKFLNSGLFITAV